MHIFIVDDHDLFRKGLAQAIQEFDHDITIGDANSIASARTILELQYQDVDLVLLDHDLPDGNGMALLQEIQQHYPLLPVAILSAHEEPALMQQILGAGALGYIPKSTSTPIILHAIHLILSGGTYIPPGLLPYMTKEKNTDGRSAEHQLTQRQSEVLKLIRNGLSNKEIANQLHISEATVKSHVTVILRVERVLTRAKLMVPNYPGDF